MFVFYLQAHSSKALAAFWKGQQVDLLKIALPSWSCWPTFVRSKADRQKEVRPDLLIGTFHEIWEQSFDPDEIWRQLCKREP